MVRVCRAGRNRFIACSCICPQHIASFERQGCATSCQYFTTRGHKRRIQVGQRQLPWQSTRHTESSRAWLSDI
ncbi:hypothetical protein NEUTE1DRAFT_117292 [Neurospora tetrasperma FGSC 2508]|uniref:Uncharacterized protein n=1 Tax=Neurospora tetrasperma (strain FGSC 2508 / ATCC MYA-4615 / P0657) TaxID=510951 RepID=F8MPP5_NEUT8|nr:uncharacterized protein NEUTE1DRAFT_117292 [Neurospora tetrasperma FGSC 2508]EGO56357.1 hypothetical protein NEUTE1DRAFT_117292 [Neurospora tetrasperma FGSC 2508]EGZ70785.1 hypothetical protein NEUTE2DRAFT_159113 [Neurospora tetrasperma FGSC 2509]